MQACRSTRSFGAAWYPSKLTLWSDISSNAYGLVMQPAFVTAAEAIARITADFAITGNMRASFCEVSPTSAMRRPAIAVPAARPLATHDCARAGAWTDARACARMRAQSDPTQLGLPVTACLGGAPRA